jgi:hypothetical protein
VCANKPYEDNLNVIFDFDNQPVVVAFDVEHNPTILENIGCAITGFDIAGSSPFGMFDFPCPFLELLFAVYVFCPEFDEFFS